ncbi:MAG: 1-deoxy-D-xylulose 5-phosphate synthase (EC [uncultured Thiotrichaceae bacterium]|uniref:1-deoxy-D-xylulose-5-phosphate synthase n=1 Tax=uncultured Thiotrichaceae bacterium TaxID=298394 RepID=A0A6S6TX64_9GAMM|nr:MAG: 1-deoxy-D-xylulose 5-phosphate synthase (EC [uncultured Thiotrichaceae bacterium]
MPIKLTVLENINSPDQIRDMDREELIDLCEELRAFLLESVSQSGGHLSANLGTVELSVALHHVFNTPDDKIVWDVGHQAYIHKILTGRRNEISNIRKKSGISGFPKRDESNYDAFGVGHSSTSISAALGMAISAKANGREQKSIAIIGDGAMTAGMAYEALNHAGDLEADLLVILNDNDMSISPNVGALNKYLTRLLSGDFYSRVREQGKKLLSATPSVQKFTKKSEEHMKGMVMPGTLFEEMGFHYFGPVDGHDLNEVVTILENLKKQKGPLLLHLVTKKGKGYEPAEVDPCGYHGVSSFDLEEGISNIKPKSTPTYTQVFGDWLCDMAKLDPKLMAITPAMREGSGMVQYSKEFPERYFDVAIAEQHAVTLAAGMACEGSKPIVAIYSTFLQRAYDQLIHDVAIQNLDVTFAIDRAGLVGADGPTHSGNYDLSYLRCIPNMVVMAPTDEDECRHMLYTAYEHKGPSTVRYPRGKGIGIYPDKAMHKIAIGKAEQLLEGSDIAILLFGSLKPEAEAVAKELGATLINMRFVKPLDEEMLRQIANTHSLLVTLEDNAIQGGAGSAVNEMLQREGITTRVLNLGLPDKYVAHATREEQLVSIGLSSENILAQIRKESCEIPLVSIPSRTFSR